MATMKDYAVSAFASLNYTREEREKKHHDMTVKMSNVIREVCLHYTDMARMALLDFEEENWIISDECGSAVLILRTLPETPYGKMEMTVKESGEIWMSIILDEVSLDGFEPIFLKGRDRTLFPLLDKMINEIKEEESLAGIRLRFGGEDIGNINF